MYICMCDFYGYPLIEEIIWDLDTIYLSQDSRTLYLRDFDHLSLRLVLMTISFDCFVWDSTKRQELKTSLNVNIAWKYNREKTTPHRSKQNTNLKLVLVFCCLNFVITPFLSHWLHGWSSGYFQSAIDCAQTPFHFQMHHVSKLSLPSKLTPKMSIGSLMILHAFMLFCPKIEMKNFQNSQTSNVCPVCCLCIAHDENLWKCLEKWEIFLIPSGDQEVPASRICILLSCILKAATLNS